MHPASELHVELFDAVGLCLRRGAVGQTLAAQELCSGPHPYMKIHHVQTGVGHYGVFNGQRWSNEIYPIVREAIQFSG